MKFFTQFDAPVDKGFDFSGFPVDQSFKDECDINNILKRFEKTGIVSHGVQESGIFDDFSNVPSYQEACNLKIAVERQFAALPAGLRDRCHNDPRQFLAMVEDPANAEELERLGVFKAVYRTPGPAPSQPDPSSKAPGGSGVGRVSGKGTKGTPASSSPGDAPDA